MSKLITVTLDEEDLNDVCNALNREATLYDNLVATRRDVPAQTINIWIWYAKRLRALSQSLIGAKKQAA